MTVNFEKNKQGFLEAKFLNKSEYEDFYKIADVIEIKLHCHFDKKVNDFDSLYWEFKYKSCSFILHYSTFLGISIYPKNAAKSSILDNKILKELIEDLIKIFE
jgi:hypothetical protein